MLIGTPAYLAPERLEGFPATPASDLWAVGILLYEALAGVKPFVGKSALAVAYAVMHHQPVPFQEWRPGVDPSLVAAVHRALEKRPERRFASAAEMAAAIGTPVTASEMPTTERPAWREDVDTALIADGTASVTQGRDPQRNVSDLVGQLMAAGKIKPRREGRTPLLGGAVVALLALLALGGVLIAGPVTTSAKRPAMAISPTTAPITTPPTAMPTTTPFTATPASAPTTAPATRHNIVVTTTSPPSASPPPGTATFAPPATPPSIPSAPTPPTAPDKAAHHQDKVGGHHGNHGD